MNLTYKLPLYLSLLVLTQCSKCKNDPTPRDPASTLPPPTQTGQNTLGCLVNGQPYTPQGRVGLGSNFYVSYDPTFNGGSLIIRTYLVTGPNNSKYLGLLGNHITQTGTYAFGPGKEANTFFDDQAHPIPCDIVDSRETTTYTQGQLTITRLDLQAGIIAGTFAATLHEPGCDTLKISQGRFDAKM